ncbi:hypothetical protein HDU97_007358 [Phlyctochytrium planicorne]|nr:hypothetical protein HDU97_007358 [Phlyctochytrium planicorne]
MSSTIRSRSTTALSTSSASASVRPSPTINIVLINPTSNPIVNLPVPASPSNAPGGRGVGVGVGVEPGGRESGSQPSPGMSTFMLVVIGASCGLAILLVWFIMIRCSIVSKINVFIGRFLKPRPTITKASPAHVQYLSSSPSGWIRSDGSRPHDPPHSGSLAAPPPPPPNSSDDFELQRFDSRDGDGDADVSTVSQDVSVSSRGLRSSGGVGASQVAALVGTGMEEEASFSRYPSGSEGADNQAAHSLARYPSISEQAPSTQPLLTPLLTFEPILLQHPTLQPSQTILSHSSPPQANIPTIPSSPPAPAPASHSQIIPGDAAVVVDATEVVVAVSPSLETSPSPTPLQPDLTTTPTGNQESKTCPDVAVVQDSRGVGLLMQRLKMHMRRGKTKWKGDVGDVERHGNDVS